MKTRGRSTAKGARLSKCRTGIRGFDDITDGRLPRGRPTLVCGGAGRGKLGIDHVRIEQSEIEETGEYDIEGLFIQLGISDCVVVRDHRVRNQIATRRLRVVPGAGGR
jgi:circadian clock protein KaiC